MADRIDDFLKGRLDRSDLTASEQQEADAVRLVAARARALTGSLEAPDMVPGVMSRIEGLDARETEAPRGGLSTLWAPREVSFQFRPVYGLAAAAAIAIVAAVTPFQRPFSEADTVAAVPGSAQLFVQFRLQAPDAMTVRLAGTFTNWEPRHELHEAEPGLWTITVPLSPGVHDYVFVVDDQTWVADPTAPQVDDGFGGTNSRIALLTPEVSRS